MANRGVTLTREQSETVNLSSKKQVFRLRVTAADNTNMPRHIFIHQPEFEDPITGESVEQYCGVMSAFDMVVYQPNVPITGQFPEYFLRDRFDILVASTELLEKAWNDTVNQVDVLIRVLNRLDWLRLVESRRLGDPLENSVSSSESV